MFRPAAVPELRRVGGAAGHWTDDREHEWISDFPADGRSSPAAAAVSGGRSPEHCLPRVCRSSSPPVTPTC
ncbi:hypothetical protein FMEAI12_5110042 [Parafrankia sp. Ea1.12]|nr:hypothetical protein FMEAI12_5110042 [Parafrankia sp. Ea1.12]